MHPLIETILPQGYRYADRFEYLMALVFADLNEEPNHTEDAKDYWGADRKIRMEKSRQT
jgi:hypothetical protein